MTAGGVILRAGIAAALVACLMSCSAYPPRS
jgi:hypothetical protein